MDLTEEQINRKIAQFMGSEIAIPINIDQMKGRQRKMYLPYTNSLDALVPVVEKLEKVTEIGFDKCADGTWLCNLFDPPHDSMCGFHEWGSVAHAYGKSPSMALATAIYHVLEGQK